MKQFAITISAALIGVLAALLLYDRLVVVPRAADQAEALAEATQVNLSKAHAEADTIATNLDTSIDRSVQGAREAMDSQASEQDKRRLATDALNRASMFKLALSEHYMSTGQWPASAKEAGLGAPESFGGGAVDAIEVGPNGVVTIRLNASLAAGAKIRLRPEANPQTYAINWHCSTEGADELRRYLPACKG